MINSKHTSVCQSTTVHRHRRMIKINCREYANIYSRIRGKKTLIIN